MKQRHLIPGSPLIDFLVRFLSLLFPREREKGRKEENGCGEGRASRNEATPCLLLETLDYSLVSQLVRGIVSGWGNSVEKGQKKTKKEVFFVSGLSLLTHPPLLHFVHPLGGKVYC